MGGGLVLFGVGGNVSGGLLDALKNNPSSSNSDLFTKRLKAAEQLVTDAAAERPGLGERGQAPLPGGRHRRQLRRQRPARSPTKGKAELAGGRPGVEPLPGPGPEEDRPDRGATYMVNAYAPNALNQTDKLVRAYELVIDATAKPTFDQYRNLAIYSYVAGPDAQGRPRARQGAGAGAQGPAQRRQAADRRAEDRGASSRRSSPAAPTSSPAASSPDSLSFAAAPL